MMKATKMFYFGVGLVAGMSLLVVYYWVLRIDSSLGLLYAHNSLNYFILYIVLTLGTSILFGVNMALLVYQWRHYGMRRIFHHSGGGVGALLGLLASSCPVCGSTALSLIGVAGGLTSLPFHGLEIKIAAFLLVGSTVLYSIVWLRKKGCKENVCPPELDDKLKQKEYIVFAPIFLMLLFLFSVTFSLYRTDLINSPDVLGESYSCGTEK